MLESNSSMLSENVEHYPYAEEESSWLEKTAMTAALVGGGVFAYKSGMLRGMVRHGLRAAGRYRKGKIRGTIKGLRAFADDDKFWEETLEQNANAFSKQKAIFRKMYEHVKKSNEQVDREYRQSKEAGYVNRQTPKLLQAVEERNKFSETIANRKLNDAQQKTFLKMMDDNIRSANNRSEEYDRQMRKRTGMRLATVRDLKNHANVEKGSTHDILMQNGKQIDNKFDDKYLDPYMYFDEKKKEIVDVRDLRSGVGDFMDSMADDFTIPFVKINPIRMFYLKSFSTENTPPLFHHFKQNEIHPTITNSNEENLGNTNLEYGFINGRVVGVDGAGHVQYEKDNQTLIEGNSPWGRLTSIMSGRTATDFEFKQGVWGTIQEKFAKTLNLGIQDERINTGGFSPEDGYNEAQGGFTWWDMTTYPSAIWEKVWDKAKPYETANAVPIHKRFIDRNNSAPDETAQYTVLSKFQSLNEIKAKDWNERYSKFMGQFSSNRENMHDASTVGMSIYAYFERLNATFGQAGFALGSSSLGSAKDVAMGLVTQRLLPVWLGMESIDWINYTGEQMFGEEPEDMMIDAYAQGQIQFAEIRDSMGLTSFFKGMSELMPGHEYLTDIAIPVPTTEGITPIRFSDIMPLTMTADELRTHYEEGEEEVRKGRYWEFGNTPFIGGKIDYYQPHWTNRLTSDWQYTDTLWGSKDEYWEHHALPSLQYPLAPIRHFITDPYHWEEKHFEDRPYPMTGEIPELAGVPLIGPALSATIGEALKPTQYMHPEEWMTPEGEVPQTLPEVYGEGQFGLMLKRSMPENMQVVQSSGNEELSQSIDMTGTPLIGLDFSNTQDREAGVEIVTSPRDVKDYPLSTSMASERFFAYETPSGGMSVFRETQMAVEDIERTVEGEGESINAVRSKTEQLEPQLPYIIGGEEETVSEASLNMAARDTWYNIAEVAGFYGFSANTVIGEPAPEGPVIQRASEMTSYSDRFWEQNIGNLGGDFNEIFRRMLPREQTMEKHNPIENTMPDWLPGEDYYIDFQHGDPYEKVQRGEIRLPGESYESLYDVEYRGTEGIPSWLLGQGPLDMVKYRLHQINEPNYKYYDRTVGSVRNNLEDEGLLINEGESYAYQGAHGESQATIAESANRSGEAPLLVKGLSQEEYENLGNSVLEEHQAELNLMTGNRNPVGYVTYYNEDNTSERTMLQGEYNGQQLEEDLADIQTSWDVIQEKMESGEITRGDFYDPVSRFRIMSDVAPYSNEYQALKEDMRNMDFTEEEQEELKTIREQLREKKDSYRQITPYKFKHSDVEKMDVTVSHILDNGMIVTEEMPDNPIRLAGVDIPRGKSDEAQAARAMLAAHLEPGETITVGVDKNQATRISNDSYDSMKAVVYEGPDDNLARTMIKEGYATEDEDDTSAPGIVARYNALERLYGSVWETFAHADTPYHTKFMHSRSALEQYERRDVYGKDWQDWANPIDDFLVPAYQNLMHTDSAAEVVLAPLAGALVGVMFGSQRRFGRMMGGAIGASVVGAGIAYAKGYEMITGERWIPERRKEERHLTEYMDALKYIKNRNLYDHYSERAMEEEDFDVQAYMEEQEREGEERQSQINQLEAYKKSLKVGDKEQRASMVREMQEEYDMSATNAEDAISFVNEQLNELRSHREVKELPELAAKAIMYYNESEKTLYGYDTGEPLSNFIQALPRTERFYFSEFTKAPEEEQDDILAIVPDYMKDPLLASWNRHDEIEGSKKSLEEIFSRTGMPEAEWKGWNPLVNLDDVKVNMARQEEIDMASLNVFNQDMQRAQNNITRTPRLDHERQNQTELQSRISELAKKWGISNTSIEITPKFEGAAGYNVVADIAQNRQHDVLQEMNHGSDELFMDE